MGCDRFITHADANALWHVGSQLNGAQSDVHDRQRRDVTHDGDAVDIADLWDDRVDDESGDEENR